MSSAPPLSTRQCHDFMDRAHKSQTGEELHTLCREICNALDCNYFMLSAVVPTSLYNPQAVTIDGYPDGFSEHYQRGSCFKRDPIARRTMEGATRPLIWEELDLTLEPDPAGSITHFKERARFGMRSGVSFPGMTREGVHTIWSLASIYPPPPGSTLVRQILPHARLIATSLQETMSRIALQTCQADLPDNPLTARERDCLALSAAGYTSGTIAEKLAVGETTVIAHLRKATSKLAATNRAQAVARAIMLGKISPPHPPTQSSS